MYTLAFQFSTLVHFSMLSAVYNITNPLYNRVSRNLLIDIIFRSQNIRNPKSFKSLSEYKKLRA